MYIFVKHVCILYAIDLLIIESINYYIVTSVIMYKTIIVNLVNFFFNLVKFIVPQ